MACCEHKMVDPIPRTPSAAVNLAHLNECCKHVDEDVDMSGIQHPHKAFMERAIYLSRVAGLEKRTGMVVALTCTVSVWFFQTAKLLRTQYCGARWECEATLAVFAAGGCFGAVVVKNGKIVGEGYNNVISHNDPTW